MILALRAWLRSLADRSHYRRLYARELEKRIAAEQLADERMRHISELRAELQLVRADRENLAVVVGWTTERAKARAVN